MFYPADIADAPAVGRIFEEFQPEIVSHLAAQLDVRRSLENPAEDATVNRPAAKETLRRVGRLIPGPPRQRTSPAKTAAA